MTILIAGGKGFIGSALVAHLQKQGIPVCILSRTPPLGGISWKELASKGLPPCEAVINLTGASIAAHKWTKSYKNELLKSRVNSTKALVDAMLASTHPPKVFINASAIGFYSSQQNEAATEASPKGEGFLSDLCEQWEEAAKFAVNVQIRSVILRMGLVLSRKGGSFKRILTPFRFGIALVVGDGYQPFSWIHIDDLISLIVFTLNTTQIEGILNATAPQCTTYGELISTLSSQLGKPLHLTLPAALLRLFLGERSCLLLEGQKVAPQKALDSGFYFQYPNLTKALTNLLH